jgi:hypothetical protein
MREPLPAFADRAEAATDAFAESVRASDVESLRRALAQLPRQQRRAFLLREFSGLTYGELAVALGVSEPAVDSLLFRARQQLRLALRSALAPVNGLLWLPLRLRDVIASAPEAPGAVKVASATAGAALLTGGVVAFAPRHHGLRPQDRPAARAATPRFSGALERRVSPRATTTLVLAHTHPRRRHETVAEPRGRQDEREAEPRETEGREAETEKPEERAVLQPVEQERSDGQESPNRSDGSDGDGGSGSGD